MKVSVLLPAYNEEKAVEDVIADVKGVKLPGKEIILIDDGSKDRTVSLAKKAGGVKVIQLAKNGGKWVALRAGFKEAKGDVIVTLDVDGTYKAKHIPKLLELIGKGKADVVIGSRFMGKPSMSAVNRLGNRFLSWTISVLTGQKVTDGSSGMRAFRKDILPKLDLESRNLEGEVEFTTKAIIKGFKVREIPISYPPRIGDTKLNKVQDGLRFFHTILKARF